MYEFKINWDDWSKATGFEVGKGTWANADVLWFKNNGFEVKHYEVIDYDKFFKLGDDYLIEKSGQSIGQWQIEHSYIPLEQKKLSRWLTRDL